MLSNQDSPFLIVVSAPSGTGKTTVVGELLKRHQHLQRVITHTTRSPRPGETNGEDYFFVNKKQFEAMIHDDALLEWAHVYSHHYGTSRSEIDRVLKQGQCPVLVIENQGAKQVKKTALDAVFILLMPPSREELEKRLFRREGDVKKDTRTRLNAARKEIQAMRWYDYVVVNQDIQQTVKRLGHIIAAERNRLSRQEQVFKSFESE